ncbi:lipopolysaccharide transport periplasmic protein LptA [Chitinimonas sp. BJYL2]|uniref:lipopolysaccharide transport periplasmic protein LptA n=1 Tax=Chitinimonas sp. BJYL2 TaxID=2976696 RepID=UPI0022B5544A|nr:lipopolysaccharide transport periplasmic protein LptA [Chitinimonas sp. BJYL2]
MPLLSAKRLLSTLLLVLPAMAAAELADGYKPIEVDAGRATQDQKSGQAVLEGGVKITQGTLTLEADRAVMQETAGGDHTVQATGKPVKFKQRLESKLAWLDAHADKLDYDSKTGEVKLMGNAWLKRGEDEISGNRITYNSVTEKYAAEGSPPDASSDGRVRMVIQSKKKPAEGQPKP